MIDERKLFFYRKISSSKNIILRTLMCLPVVSSDYMFLCSKYGVRPTSTRDSIKDAVMWHHWVLICSLFIVGDFYVFCMLVFYCAALVA